MRRPLRTTWVLCTIFWWTLLHLSPGWSQTVAPITPSGLNTQVNLSAAPPAGTIQHDITGGTRTGANLFHSFGDFNVPNSHIANFLNDTGLDTANILGRVTGGNISTIFGTIQTTGFRNANLFLMNPAGIVFGPTASLNVGGSVAFTTANYLRLTDNTVFHALPNTNADALLSTAPVAAYGFLTSTPGAITIQGSQLRFPQEHSISLVGGNITIQNGTLENGTTQPARLSAPNGQLNLGATQSAGEFLQDLAAAPNIDGTSFRSYGSAHFASGSTADFSQTGNGTISIRGGQLVLDIQHAVLETSMALSPLVALPNQDTIFLAPGSSIVSGTSSEDLGPNIQVVTDHLQFLGSPHHLRKCQAPQLRSGPGQMGAAMRVILRYKQRESRTTQPGQGRVRCRIYTGRNFTIRARPCTRKCGQCRADKQGWKHSDDWVWNLGYLSNRE